MCRSGLLAATLLTGCGLQCASVEEHAAVVGRAGLPLEASLAEMTGVCHAAFAAAWRTGNAHFCAPDRAFATGYSDTIYYGVCDHPDFLRDYRLGRILWLLEREQDAVTAVLRGAGSGEFMALRARARELEREITELRTEARLRGLIPPAELPDGG